MEKLHIALLLLDLNKTETKLFVLLHLLKNTENKNTVYKIEQICELLGFDRSTIINAFATLENKNIVGKLVFESGLVEKKIAKGFVLVKFTAPYQYANLDPKLLEGVKGHEGCVILVINHEDVKKVVKKLRIRNYPSIALFHVSVVNTL